MQNGGVMTAVVCFVVFNLASVLGIAIGLFLGTIFSPKGTNHDA